MDQPPDILKKLVDMWVDQKENYIDLKYILDVISYI